MSARACKIGEKRGKHDYERRLREMNGALLISSVRQHEPTEEAERAAAALRTSEDRLRALNESLERRIAERTSVVVDYRQRLRALMIELGRSETRERMRIAGELHDYLVQLLVVCKLNVSSIEACAPPGSAMAADAGAVKQFLGEGIDYTRTLMAELRPDVLDNRDAMAAIQWLARRMERHGLVVRVEDDGHPKPLDEERVTLIVDGVRELLFNSLKHSGTKQATVVFIRAGSKVRVTVSDKGAGFDPTKMGAKPSRHGGFGLFSIGERLRMVRGRIEIESALGRGANITLIVPLHARRKAVGAPSM